MFALLTMIGRNNKCIQTYTDICTHQAENAHQHSFSLPSSPPSINPPHLKSPHIPLYIFFPRPWAFTSHNPPAWQSSDGEQEQANKTKGFKNKHQEDHCTQINRSKRGLSAKGTKKHTVNTPGFNTARSLTQEVRQREPWKAGAEHRKSFSTAEISKSGVMERAQE